MTAKTDEYSEKFELLDNISALPDEPSKVWLFQADIKYFDLRTKVHVPAGLEYWTLKTNFKKVQKGDFAVLWQTGQKSGVYAFGELCSEPYQQNDGWVADIRYLCSLTKPILEQTLKVDPVLRSLRNLEFRNAGNPYSVSMSQWKSLLALLRKSLAAVEPSWWWVCQGQNWIEESKGGYIHADPGKGRHISHRENIHHVKPGDVVVHYAEGVIQATGEVVSDPEPFESGHRAKVSYTALKFPITLNDIPLPWRRAERYTGSAFDKNGEVNQGYLYPLSGLFAQRLYDLLKSRIPQQDLPPRPRPTHRQNEDKISSDLWSYLSIVANSGEMATIAEITQNLDIDESIATRVLGRISLYCIQTDLPQLVLVLKWIHLTLATLAPLYPSPPLADLALSEVYAFKHWQENNPFQYADDGISEATIIQQLKEQPERSAEVWRSVKVRGAAQLFFRTSLRDLYKDQCAFCGLSIPEALEAAHIIPWSLADDTQKMSVQNGLLLCSTHHRLFDAGMMTIDDSYRISVKRGLSTQADGNRTITMDLHGKRARVPDVQQHQPSTTLVRMHNQLLVCSEIGDHCQFEKNPH